MSLLHSTQVAFMHGHCIFRKLSFTNWSAKWLWNLWHLCHLCRSGWPGMRVLQVAHVTWLTCLRFSWNTLWGRRCSWRGRRCAWCWAFRPFRATRTAPGATLTDLGRLPSRIRVRITAREIGTEITNIRNIRHISLSSSFSAFSDFSTFLLLSYNFSLWSLMCLFGVFSLLGLGISGFSGFSRLILNSSDNDRETLGRWISAAPMARTSTFDPGLGSFGLVSGSLPVGRRPGSRNVPQVVIKVESRKLRSQSQINISKLSKLPTDIRFFEVQWTDYNIIVQVAWAAEKMSRPLVPQTSHEVKMEWKRPTVQSKHHSTDNGGSSDLDSWDSWQDWNSLEFSAQSSQSSQSRWTRHLRRPWHRWPRPRALLGRRPRTRAAHARAGRGHAPWARLKPMAAD